MCYANRLAFIAAAAVVATASSRSLSRAADNDQPTNASNAIQAPSAARPIYATSSTWPTGQENGLLQQQLSDHAGLGSTFDNYGLKLTGRVDAGFTYNFQRPETGSNGPGYAFTEKSDDPTFNQVGLKLERNVPYSADTFDLGFTTEVIYGSDARFTQANGTNFYGPNYAHARRLSFFEQGGNPTPFVDTVGLAGQPYPENQIDFLQFNLKANIPIGNGLILTAGKFVTPFGLESIDPTNNLFYTHSYIFSLSLPRTLTGVTGSYAIDPNWSVMGGVVLGWDQSLEDNNNMVSGIGGIKYRSDDDNWGATLSAIFGPEEFDDRSDARLIIDGTVDWRWEKFWFGVEGIFGSEPDVGVPIAFVGTGGPLPLPLRQVTDKDATWFGAAVYASVPLDPEEAWNLVGRLEYFSDTDGGLLLSTEVYSAAIGLNIIPFKNNEVGKNLMIRPEVRYDFANDAIFDGGLGLGGDGTDSQITASCDVIFRF